MAVKIMDKPLESDGGGAKNTKSPQEKKREKQFVHMKLG